MHGPVIKAQTSLTLASFHTLQPSAIGIIGLSIPPSQAKSTSFATFSAGAPLGAGVGLVLGGVYVETSQISQQTGN